MKERVTSTDVARHAGVSQSAVSRAFTPGASIGRETREKVLASARALGYRPNALARSLITNRSHIIAVAMAYLDNQFYPDVLQYLTKSLQELGYQVLLFTGFKERESDPMISQILQYQVDGIILASTTLSSALSDECASAGVPIVLFNRTTRRGTVASVTSDNVAGGRRVAEFLLAGGHKTFAYIAGLAASSTNADREAGFYRALAEAGISDVLRYSGDYSDDVAKIAARQLFSEHRPDAVFCANDHMALAVLDVARFEYGLKVPDDVSIVGYDNVRAGSWSSYSLTTVEQPVELMVDRSIDMLMSQIENPSEKPRSEVIRGDIVIRKSAKLPKYI